MYEYNTMLGFFEMDLKALLYIIYLFLVFILKYPFCIIFNILRFSTFLLIYSSLLDL